MRLVRITDIDKWGCLITEGKKYVDIANDIDRSSCQLKKGDLLIARTGATYGKMLYFDSDEESVFASYLIRLVPKSSAIITKYLWYFSFSQSYWKQANELVTGGTQPQFNANKIENIMIPVPSIIEQQRVISQLDKETEALEKVHFLKEQAEKLIKRTLTEIWGEKDEENGNP